jgi:NAD(P)-dependent dehydrogenase (short-subunit alcohol dehydrogenase family)
MPDAAQSLAYFRLDDRVILVTGAARGVGRAISERIIASGGRVAGIDVNGEGLTASAQSYPDCFFPIAGSITDPAFAARAVE